MVAAATSQVFAVTCGGNNVSLVRWLVVATMLCFGQPSQADARLLIVSGIGGEDRFSQQFRDWALQMRDAAMGPLGMEPRDVVWLCELPQRDPTQCAGESRRESILEAIAAMLGGGLGDGSDVRPLMMLMIGHGTTRDGRALFNVRGPDLSAQDLNDLFETVHKSPPEQMIAVVNTTPSSALFAQLLGPRGRIVVTATARSQESDHTRFAAHFVAAYAAGGADADRDGRVSLLEAFQFAVREVTREYADKRQVSTEHAMLEDNADGEGAHKPQVDGDVAGGARGERGVTRKMDGAVAAHFFLASAVRREGLSAARLKLENEARNLVTRISALRWRKAAMHPSDYLQKLETLLVELALNRAIVREGGS
ncbi:MAG: hypothetical protein ACI9DC_002278 [Gammaproteobacteria bacterium]|jgi:hypothetical protein